MGDLAETSRWPTLAARCVEQTSMRNLISIPLDLGGSDGAAVTCYAARPFAFVPADVTAGQALELLKASAEAGGPHLRDIAMEVAAQGGLPDPPSRPSEDEARPV